MHRIALLRSFALLAAVALAGPLHAQFGYVVTSYHGVSHASHQASFNTLSAQGYRPISLAVAGGYANANYSAVWWQVAGPNWVSAHGMTESQYTAQRTAWAIQGFRPKLVTASGSGTDKVYAAVYVQDGVSVSHQINMSLSAFESDAAAKRTAGYRLVSCATYGTAIAPLFAPVYELVDDVAWGWEANDTAAQFTDNIADHVDGENRPAFFGMTDFQRYLSIWHDDRVGAWAWVGNRTSAEFAADRLAMQNAGLYPLSYAAGGSGTNARFSGVFVERLTPYARTLTHSGPASIPLAPLDTMMNDFVTEHRVRSAALAVIRDGRLVHARGFTYAEPGYPQTTPTSLFRIGSISKPLCGMVAHDLIEHGVGGLTLSTNMVNQLGITNYGTGVGSITLQQLLTHTSGLVDAVDELAAATWWNPGNPTMPPDESVIVRYAALPAATTSGQWRYSNAGNTAIGQMIEQATGQGYLTALGSRLMTPLGVTRFGRQQGPRNLLLPGEVHYHLRDLYLRPGNWYTDLRLVAPQYSQRFWDSAGGVVTSAVDLARVIAGSFQIGGDSPVFGVARQAAILNRQTYPVNGSPGSTRQWTDGAWRWLEHAPGEYTYWHDGAQDGFRALCMFRTDGIGVVTLFNGDHNLSTSSIQIALAGVTSWPTDDQFPNHGLPTFPRTPSLSFHLPINVPNVGPDPIVFTGTNLDQVTSVLFDSTPLTSTLFPSTVNGRFQLVDYDTLWVFPPQGVQAGAHTVRAFSAQGGGNTATVQIVLQPDFTLVAPDWVFGGSSPFSVWASQGPLTNLSFVALGFSQSTSPSIVPGVVSLGIGNQFADLFTTDLRSFSPFGHVTRWDFPGLASWSHVDLQAIAIDFGVPAQFPLETSNVFTVDRY